MSETYISKEQAQLIRKSIESTFAMNYNQYGFQYVGSCSCDGRNTEKYKRGEWQLRHRPKHGTYKFKKNGQTMSDWMDREKAEQFIKEKICDSLEHVN